jgi:2,4-dienoyl-CoA reductase-like NADH-dependent reductase (Old Yellow Enzyme family)
MTKMHERFKYKTKDDLIQKVKTLGFDLPFSEDLAPLFQPYQLAGFLIANRLVVQPMEGYDSENDGSPSELSRRRYLRYASGGSGIIWHEAVSVMHEGRSNPHQLWIHKKNSDSFSRLNDQVRKDAVKQGIDPFLVVQLTHSGRYSKPEGVPKPQVAALNPLLDKTPPHILTDDDLKRIMDQFVEASKLARKSGFNAVDLKACHGYLVVELLSAKTRMNSIFGGNETSGRFRFLLETIDRIRDEVPGISITIRLSITDLYKGGFGVDENGEHDFTEPLLLAGQLKIRGIGLINITMGSPYFNPHVNRPYDNPLPGQNKPKEHPLEGVMRMINGTSFFQEKFPGIAMVGSAWSFLRHYAPNAGASVIRNGQASFIGFGRNSFAYPSMPLDLMKNGKADQRRTCITCSGCTRLIRSLRPGGCVIHDKKIYGNELKKLIADEK